jgi:CheY-like chemotaxis protein
MVHYLRKLGASNPIVQQCPWAYLADSMLRAHHSSSASCGHANGSAPIRRAKSNDVRRLDCRGYPVTKRILVVDDKAHLLRLMRMILEDEHYQVSILQEGRGAFDRVKESLPDLVILDLKLADSSGLEILRDLKGDRTTADIPVIVYTAAVLEAEEVLQLIASDPARYQSVRVLQKPFDLDALLGMVQEVLGAGDLC